MQDVQLWAYLKCAGPPGNHWVRDVTNALKELKALGMVEQLGTSNHASPYKPSASQGKAARQGRAQPAALAARYGAASQPGEDLSQERLDEGGHSEASPSRSHSADLSDEE